MAEGRLSWMETAEVSAAGEERIRNAARSGRLRVGYSEIFSGEPDRAAPFVRDSVRCLDEAGFDTIWVPEHVVLFESYASEYPYGTPGRQEVTRSRPEPGNVGPKGFMDGVVLLSAIAQFTTRMRVGTYIVILGQRNPVVFARQVATLDQMSEGRMNLGIGVGWSQEEHEAVGVPFERRGARVDEYIDAMRALWTTDPSEFHGEFVDFPPLLAYPKPHQQPHPPIHVAGQSKRALRRAAEKGDGVILYNLEIRDIEVCLDELDRHLDVAGRTLDDIDVVVGRKNEGRDLASFESDREFIDQCRALGAINEVVCSPRFPSGDRWFELMAQYTEVLELSAPPVEQ
jgi:probable F420-dependent oxidoreductase